MSELSGNIDKSGSRRGTIWRTLLTGFAFILGFVVLGIIAIQAWEYSNSVSFCSDVCHDVHPEEPSAYQDFYHASVKCTECHTGRVSTLQAVVLKASHFRHLPAVIMNRYERPLESATMRPANESCERCHWPPAFHGDTVREIKRFLPDENNTEKRTYLILKTGAGTREQGLGFGIHWHITSRVEYIATDERKQAIRWVRSTLPDGRTVEYNDVTNPLSPEEIATAPKRVMDCVDCHNRMGHPFPSPEDLVDEALAGRRLNTDLPYAKKELLALLNNNYTNREAALQTVASFKETYMTTYPEVAASRADDIAQAQELAQEFITRLVFEEPGVTWRSFPDNSKHKDFPGCFRCHDGKHLSAEGESIRLHCNICHSIPVTVSGSDRPPQMPVAYIQEPSSHLETNFIADHRFQANSVCTECHGEVAFGNDDSSFCANSACHGRAWPMVNLDAAFPHPIPLEGKHAQVWCHNCHNGVEKPEYRCANCHQPPAQPHFGDRCEECHTPAGFEQVVLTSFVHPVPLEGAHASINCTACHTGSQKPVYECASCHQPPSTPHFGPNCGECHTPAGFKGATLPPELHPVPLVGAHLQATCSTCHAEGRPTPEYVCSNCHTPPAQHLEGRCDICHTPDGWVESAARIVALASKISHELEGRENCLVCHDPQGEIRPAPLGHIKYVNAQCILCHKAEED